MPKNITPVKIEYRLLIEKVFDETVQKEGIRFFLETSKQFTNFNYSIAVEEISTEKEIIWKLHGLKAPLTSMATFGAAQYSQIYFDLKNAVSFQLQKNNKENIFVSIKFLRNSIKADVEKSSWLTVYTDSKEFLIHRLRDGEHPSVKPDIHRKPHPVK